MRMILRLLLCLVLACSLISCSTDKQKKDKATAAEKAKREDMEDMGGDPSFLSFIGRLRQAVATHDIDTLAPMMTSNFGYNLADPKGEGPGVFQYWDQNNLWPQLQKVLDQHFLPKDNFMVSPPGFVTDPNYHGYRAGLTSVDGSWKFAYFVTD
jgi:hypothetical protein